MRLSSLNLAPIALMVLFWYPAQGLGASCTVNQTSYQRPISETHYLTRTTSTLTTTQRKSCNPFKQFFYWIVSHDGCEQKTILVYRVGYKKVSHEVLKYIDECCLGYEKKNQSSNCVKSECAPGRYGTNCSENCTCGNLELYCDNNGTCICPEGFNGTNCTEECDATHFGRNCVFECECSNKSICNNTDGTCNCTSPGWEGDFCNQECNSTRFGLYCTENCTCNENQTCNPINGTCTCKPGWKGDNCTNACERGSFGIGCNKTCTCNNETSVSCNATNGHCLCKPGYLGINCNHVCATGTYGEGCNNNCSNSCDKPMECYYIDGSCVCPGSKGENCSEQCEPGTFGFNCSSLCGERCNFSNGNGTCNSTTGQCTCLDNWTGPNCTVAAITMDNTTNIRGIDTNDIMIIMISAGSGLVFLIIGGSIICRKRSTSRDKASIEGAAGTVENKTYTRNTANDQTQEPTDKFAQESEMNDCLTQNGVVTVKDDVEADKRSSSSEAEDHGSIAADQVVYEDADIELDNLENNNKPKLDEQDDYDKTHAANNIDTCFKDDDVLYESADDYDENTPEREPNHYNTFEEVGKIRLNSIDHDKDEEGEEDYNVLEHFPNQSKKVSLKEETHYSSFDAVKRASKQNDSEKEESDYDCLNESRVPRGNVCIAHERYHHIDLKSKTIDGDKVVAVSSPDTRISASYKEQEDEDEIKSDIHEVIYEECMPEVSMEDDSQKSKVPEVLEKHDSAETAEIVYESCGSSDEDGVVTKNENDIVYESMSDDESQEDGNSGDNQEGNKTRIKDIKSVRQRRSEDYEEFEL